MLLEKRLHGRAGVIACTILNEDEVFTRLADHVGQEGGIRLRVQASFVALIKEAAGKIIDQAKDLVTLALTGGGHRRLLAAWRPALRQCPPLRKRRLIAKQHIGLFLLGLRQNLGPALHQPWAAFLRVEVVGHKPGFLIGKAHILE